MNHHSKATLLSLLFTNTIWATINHHRTASFLSLHFTNTMNHHSKDTPLSLLFTNTIWLVRFFVTRGESYSVVWICQKMYKFYHYWLKWKWLKNLPWGCKFWDKLEASLHNIVLLCTSTEPDFLSLFLHKSIFFKALMLCCMVAGWNEELQM